MRKYLFFIILLVFLTGCSTISQSDQEGDINYKSGTRAVEIKILDNAPPTVVYDGDIFDIGIEMWNRGTEVVPEGYLVITGFDNSIIAPSSFGTGRQRPDLQEIPDSNERIPFSFGEEQRRTQYNTEGGFRQFFFTGSAHLPEDSTRITIPLRVYSCYKYSTSAVLSVCLDPEPWRTDVDKACSPGSTIGTGGQGSPVTISGVDIEPMKSGTEAKFRISITNSGDGTVIDEDYVLASCPTSYYPSDINKIKIQSVELGGVRLTCNPLNLNLGTSGSGYIYCQGDLKQANAYVTTLKVILNYGYRNVASKDFEIRKI